jgi:hypothetical protein
VKQTARILISPFEPPSKHTRAPLTQEAEQLIHFVEPDARSFEVRFVDSSESV